MIIRLDPIFGLFEKNSVRWVVLKALPGESRFESRLLLDIIDLFYNCDDPVPQTDLYIQSVPPARLHKAVKLWKQLSLAESIPGRGVQIMSDILRSHPDQLTYAAFPGRLFQTMAYYKNVSPDELWYIVSWTKEAGLSEELVLHAVKSALSLNNQIQLTELTDFIMQQAGASGAEHEACYRLALAVLDTFGQAKRDPGHMETQYIMEWLALGFSESDILLACQQATDSPTFRYTDAILRNARKCMDDAGIGTYSELMAVTEEYKTLTCASGSKELTPAAICLFSLLRKEYPPESIRLAAGYVMEEYPKTRTRITCIRRVLQRWKERGMDTPEKISEYMSGLREAKALLGSIISIPDILLTDEERKEVVRLITRWKKKGYEDEDILYAAQCAADVGAQKPVAYMRKVLK